MLMPFRSLMLRLVRAGGAAERSGESDSCARPGPGRFGVVGMADDLTCGVAKDVVRKITGGRLQRRRLQRIRVVADPDDAARLDHIELAAASLFHQLVAFRARIDSD